jgi:hypothetical protein
MMNGKRKVKRVYFAYRNGSPGQIADVVVFALREPATVQMMIQPKTRNTKDFSCATTWCRYQTATMQSRKARLLL